MLMLSVSRPSNSQVGSGTSIIPTIATTTTARTMSEYFLMDRGEEVIGSAHPTVLKARTPSAFATRAPTPGRSQPARGAPALLSPPGDAPPRPLAPARARCDPQDHYTADVRQRPISPE